jgi:uncharacterized SAM-binding protein YcdF (DUF218 family)
MDVRVHALAETLWQYHHMGHDLKPADAILVLCSHDTAVAERGAQLFLDGWAPRLVFSGGLGVITRHLWSEPEADQFAAIARRMGVPDHCVLIENASTNTGENVALTRRLLEARGLDLQTFIVVQKPYMERRAFATFQQVWPGKDLVVTSPQVAMDDYLAAYSNETLTPADVISIMVGDLQRIAVYPARGFQVPQEIPDHVMDAFHQLVALGYDRHLVNPRPPECPEGAQP